MESEVGVIKHDVSKKRYMNSLKLFSSFQEKKTRQYTTVILTFIALVVFGVLAINPTITTIVQLRKQLVDSKLLDQQLTDKITHLQSLQSQYSELTPDLPLIESAYPVTPETPILLGQIQTLIAENNLTTDQIEMERVPYTKDGLPSGTQGSYVVKFSVSGTFSDINAFTKTVTTINRVVTLDEIIIVRDAENPSLIRAITGVRAYFDQKPL